jgi:O-antigen/teichoic acid export membrane protein
MSVFWGIAGAVLGLLAAHVITALVVRVAASRDHARSTPSGAAPGTSASASREPRRLLRRAIAFGVRGYAANALQTINYRLDLLILNAVAAGVAAGHYAVAVSITSVVWLAPQAISEVLFPRVAALRASAGKGQAQLLASAEAKALRHATLAALGVSAVLVPALVLLVRPLYGAGFGASIELGLILLPGAALLALANPLASAIVGRGHPGMTLAATAIVTPPTIIMYALLIPALHAPGAALASTISYTAVTLLNARFYRRVTGLSVIRQMLPTAGELTDYVAFGRAVKARIAAMLGRRARSSSKASAKLA